MSSSVSVVSVVSRN